MFESTSRKILLIAAATVIGIVVWTMLAQGVVTDFFGSLIIGGLGIALAGWMTQRDKLSKFGFEYGAVEERLGYRSDLLEVLTASEPRSLILADKWERILFANREAAQRIGRNPDSLIGSSISTVVGDKKAALTAKRLQTAYKNKMPVIQIDEEQSGLLRQIMQTSFMPIKNTAYIKDAVLITETDITSIVIERENRERMLRQLLDVCVAIIDKRDPYAAGHSALVGDLARGIAREMHLDDMEVDTAEISGLLMNFGKVLVPQEILTKTTALTPDELKLVRDSMMSSADVLSLIQFDLPVVETLRQVFERVDGTGQPEGRKGDDIIITARICNLANSFVALASRRAHREGLDVSNALEILKKDAGKIFDHGAIRALESLLQSGRMKKEIDRVAGRATTTAA